MRDSDEWYVDYVSELTPEELVESIDFTFTDGDPGRMSRAERVTHVIVHGGYRDILLGATGRNGDVLKIRSPLTFARQHADLLLQELERTLSEG
jgi:4-aminobutyrate aminotransferase-like enzyme